MNPQKTVEHLFLACPGDVSEETMIAYDDQLLPSPPTFGFTGIEAGGLIKLLTATTAVVEVADDVGRVILPSGTPYTQDTSIDPIPTGVRGPLRVTVTASDGTLEIHWFVRR